MRQKDLGAAGHCFASSASPARGSLTCQMGMTAIRTLCQRPVWDLLYPPHAAKERGLELGPSTEEGEGPDPEQEQPGPWGAVPRWPPACPSRTGIYLIPH